MEKLVNFMYDSIIKTSYSDRKISTMLGPVLIKFLDDVADVHSEELKKFRPKWMIVKKNLTNTSHRELSRLKHILPRGTVISDLNSAIMGIPALADSDLDFTIPVNSLTHQKELADILVLHGYMLHRTYEDGSKIPWLSFQRFTSSKVEIEVKLRALKKVEQVLISHRGIKEKLTSTQKLVASYVKSNLKGVEYKKFKYIIYGAMFQGHARTIIFRTD